MSSFWQHLLNPGDPEGEALANASTAMEPVTTPVLGTLTIADEKSINKTAAMLGVSPMAVMSFTMVPDAAELLIPGVGEAKAAQVAFKLEKLANGAWTLIKREKTAAELGEAAVKTERTVTREGEAIKSGEAAHPHAPVREAEPKPTAAQSATTVEEAHQTALRAEELRTAQLATEAAEHKVATEAAKRSVAEAEAAAPRTIAPEPTAGAATPGASAAAMAKEPGFMGRAGSFAAKEVGDAGRGLWRTAVGRGSSAPNTLGGWTGWIAGQPVNLLVTRPAKWAAEKSAKAFLWGAGIWGAGAAGTAYFGGWDTYADYSLRGAKTAGNWALSGIESAGGYALSGAEHLGGKAISTLTSTVDIAQANPSSTAPSHSVATVQKPETTTQAASGTSIAQTGNIKVGSPPPQSPTQPPRQPGAGGPVTPVGDPKAALTGCLHQPEALGDRTGKTIHPEGSNPKLENPKGVCAFHFAYDRADAPPPADAKANAVKVRAWLDQNKGRKMWILGGCDTDGSIGYNKTLGMRRAHTAQDALIEASKGVDGKPTLSKDDFVLVTNGKEVLWKNEQGKVPENRYAVMFGGPPAAHVAPTVTPHEAPDSPPIASNNMPPNFVMAPGGFAPPPLPMQMAVPMRVGVPYGYAAELPIGHGRGFGWAGNPLARALGLIPNHNPYRGNVGILRPHIGGGISAGWAGHGFHRGFGV